MPKRREPPIALEPFCSLPNGAKAKRCTYVRHKNQKRPNTQCDKPAAYGTDRCITHGAKSQLAEGPANANWRGGVSRAVRERWVNRFPGPMQEDYLAALRDPDILSLEAEIALIDVRLGELVERTGRHADWSEVRIVYEDLRSAMQGNNADGIRSALLRLKDLAESNVSNDRAWREVVKLTDRRRRLVESERRRLVEQNLFLTREQAHAYGHALLESVTRHVHDKETLLRVVADFRAIIDAGRYPERDRTESALALVVNNKRRDSD